jgi:hypothetical protein
LTRPKAERYTTVIINQTQGVHMNENQDDYLSFKHNTKVTISISIKIGTARPLKVKVAGTAYPDGIVDEAIAELGKAERHWIPNAIDEQFESKNE